MRRGALLILVLWVLVIAGVMLVGLNRAVQVDSAVAHGQLEMVRARWAARAGIEQARSVLDLDSALSDDMTDYWYDSALDFQDIELADGSTFNVVASPPAGSVATVRYGMTDEASGVNVNHASEVILAELPNITPAQVDAIIDWRDSDERARPAGAERGQYSSLDLPYVIRNGPMQTHREMLLIEGIDSDVFYGEDLNGDGILSPGENDGDAAAPDDDADGMLDPGLRQWTTVYSYVQNQATLGSTLINLTQSNEDQLQTTFNFTEGLARAVMEEARSNPDDLFEFENVQGEASGGDGSPRRSGGADEPVNQITLRWLAEHWEELTLSDEATLPGRINVNTAPREVLAVVPGLTDESVEKILDVRAGALGGFLSVGDLLLDGVLTDDRWKEAAPHLTVSSNVFRVVSIGQSGGAVRRIEAVLDRGNNMAVMYWRQDGQ